MPFPSESEARVTHIRSAMARMIRGLLVDAAGPEAWQALLTQLTEASRTLGEPGADLPEWVPAEFLSDWADAFRYRLGPAPIGSNLIDLLLEDAHPWIARASDPGLAALSIPKIFQHYHKGGVLRIAQLAAGEADLDLWAFLAYPGWHDQLLPAAFVRTLERCGARDVAARSLPVDPADPPYHHRYRLTWR
ncbi:MAG: hypothetical protein U0P81_00790 [Holophagaceae bacterium]